MGQATEKESWIFGKRQPLVLSAIFLDRNTPAGPSSSPTELRLRKLLQPTSQSDRSQRRLQQLSGQHLCSRRLELHDTL